MGTFAGFALRLLLATHATTIGGSQLACQALAPALAARGHDVLVVGPDGPLARSFAVPFVDGGWVHQPGRRPSVRVAASLTRLARAHAADVVHVFGGVAISREAFAGPHIIDRRPVVATDYGSPGRTRYPSTMPLVIGRPAFLTAMRSARSGLVEAVPPPVDVEGDNPVRRAGSFLAAHGVPPDLSVIVIVARLEEHQKGPGVRAAIDAMAALGSDATLVLVGDGAARPGFERRAASVNAAVGRRAVALVGEMIDPRPAYAAADVVLGLGTSALRGMAFAKPVVVLGEDGSGEILTAANAERFQREGFFATHATEPLVDEIRQVLSAGERTPALGEFGRRFVVANRSPAAAAALLEGVYERALNEPRRRLVAAADLARVTLGSLPARARSVLRRGG